MQLRLGDLLVRSGALTEDERDAIVDAQGVSRRPFGVIAEEMFGVDPGVVERAWAEQYAASTRFVDLEACHPSPDVIGEVDRRQAWQFAMLPMERDGDELVCCTTAAHLPRALRFAGWRLGGSVSFVVSDRQRLGAALARCYPMGGADAEDLLEPEAVPSPGA
ncbi:MAG: hypothetical protein AAGK04_13760 [Planctomycetota bacterium]